MVSEPKKIFFSRVGRMSLSLDLVRHHSLTVFNKLKGALRSDKNNEKHPKIESPYILEVGFE